MKKSDVYFIRRSTAGNGPMMGRLKKLLKKMNLSGIIKENYLVALKTHFGEPGLTTFLRPVFVRPFADEIKKLRAHPFLTDANTLYMGGRTNAVTHLETALKNGFNFLSTGAPVIIADGIDGNDYEEVTVDCDYFDKVRIAGEAHRANSMIVLTHFTGHESFGFGGALKNIGMGLAAKKGKVRLHSASKLFIKKKACRKCGICLDWCQFTAIRMISSGAVIDEKKCTGCGHCISACSRHAIKLRWDMSIPEMQKKTAEYALGAVKSKNGRVRYFNFIMDVTPECDCYGHSDSPIVPDLGILASDDPVAVDQASYDLVNNSVSIKGSRAEKSIPGEDKFRQCYPMTDPEILLEYAEKIGLGRRKYRLIDF
ncbi:MAG: DUF362 domain-containing protein [Elusimicrobiota bacterium]